MCRLEFKEHSTLHSYSAWVIRIEHTDFSRGRSWFVCLYLLSTQPNSFSVVETPEDVVNDEGIPIRRRVSQGSILSGYSTSKLT